MLECNQALVHRVVTVFLVYMHCCSQGVPSVYHWVHSFWLQADDFRCHGKNPRVHLFFVGMSVCCSVCVCCITSARRRPRSASRDTPFDAAECTGVHRGIAFSIRRFLVEETSVEDRQISQIPPSAALPTMFSYVQLCTTPHSTYFGTCTCT